MWQSCQSPSGFPRKQSVRLVALAWSGLAIEQMAERTGCSVEQVRSMIDEESMQPSLLRQSAGRWAGGGQASGLATQLEGMHLAVEIRGVDDAIAYYRRSREAPLLPGLDSVFTRRIQIIQRMAPVARSSATSEPLRDAG